MTKLIIAFRNFVNTSETTFKFVNWRYDFFVAKRSLKSAGFSDLFPKLAPLVRLDGRGGALECSDPECLMDLW